MKTEQEIIDAAVRCFKGSSEVDVETILKWMSVSAVVERPQAIYLGMLGILTIWDWIQYNRAWAELGKNIRKARLAQQHDKPPASKSTRLQPRSTRRKARGLL